MLGKVEGLGREVFTDECTGGQSGDPHREKAARFDLVGKREGEDRERDEGDALIPLVAVAAVGRRPDQPTAENAGGQTDQGRADEDDGQRLDRARLRVDTRRDLADGDEDRDERQGQPVVQSALDVDRVADDRGNARVRDHGLAERRVGGGEDHADQPCLPRLHAREHDECDDRAEEHRHRQAEPEETARETRFAGPAADIERRRVGEEDHDERGLEDRHDHLATRNVAKKQWPGDEPDGHEEDRDGHDRLFQATRHERVCEEGAGQQRQRRDRHRGARPGIVELSGRHSSIMIGGDQAMSAIRRMAL